MEETRDATIHDGASIPRPITANRSKSPSLQEFVFKQVLCVVAYHIIANQAIMPATNPWPVIFFIRMSFYAKLMR